MSKWMVRSLTEKNKRLLREAAADRLGYLRIPANSVTIAVLFRSVFRALGLPNLEDSPNDRAGQIYGEIKKWAPKYSDSMTLDLLLICDDKIINGENV